MKIFALPLGIVCILSALLVALWLEPSQANAADRQPFYVMSIELGQLKLYDQPCQLPKDLLSQQHPRLQQIKRFGHGQVDVRPTQRGIVQQRTILQVCWAYYSGDHEQPPAIVGYDEDGDAFYFPMPTVINNSLY